MKKVELDKTTLDLFVGQEEQLTATISPEEVTNQKVTWESSKPEIAIVDQDGKVTAVRKGQVFITATAKNNSKIVAKCEILSFNMVFLLKVLNLKKQK